MALRRIAGTCEGGPCPTVYEMDNGKCVVQGFIVEDVELLAELGLPPGETAVIVPRELIVQAGHAYNA